jgi:hypothetical protein
MRAKGWSSALPAIVNRESKIGCEWRLQGKKVAIEKRKARASGIGIDRGDWGSEGVIHGRGKVKVQWGKKEREEGKR